MDVLGGVVADLVFLPFGLLWVDLCVFMFKIYSWNVRGLNNPSKRNAVRFVLSKIRNVVVCIQESKVRHVSGSFLKSFGGPFLDKH